MEQERLHPEATGELSNLLYDICLAAKIISRQVRRAGLTDILGESGTINVQGEVQQKLDLFANETVRHSVEHTGRVCVVASEEDEHPIPVAVRADRRDDVARGEFRFDREVPALGIVGHLIFAGEAVRVAGTAGGSHVHREPLDR